MTKKPTASVEQPSTAGQSSAIAMLQETVRTLTNRVNELLGVPQIASDGKVGHRPDFVEFGSPRHAALLGVIVVDDPSTLLDGELSYESPKTKALYKLEDSITPFLSYPNPPLIAQLTLRQKVNVFEAGPPIIPSDSPSLMTFDDPELARMVQIGAVSYEPGG